VLLEDDEMKFIISSFQEDLRGLSSIMPTNMEQAYAIKNIIANACQVCNKMFFSTLTPSKITTKRQHSFLSPINKRRKCGRDLKARKDKLHFQKVGRLRAKKKNMNEQLGLASQRQRNLEETLDVQPSVLHNIGMEI